MMVTTKATAPGLAAPSSEHQQHAGESITLEPLTCGLCANAVNVYQLGDDKWICEDHLKGAVVLASCDIWPGSVRYDKAFEDSLW